MSAFEIESILEMLEKDAGVVYEAWSTEETGILAAAQVSIAISLKRIAAAMEKAC